MTLSGFCITVSAVELHSEAEMRLLLLLLPRVRTLVAAHGSVALERIKELCSRKASRPLRWPAGWVDRRREDFRRSFGEKDGTAM